MSIDNPANIPLAAYVHIPWCIKKCPYCDFNSHQQTDATDEQQYCDKLADNLSTLKSEHGQKELASIFFGGGTPSLFSGSSIGFILQSLNQHFQFKSDIEVTLEANPGTIEQEKFSSYIASGVNRLSIGIQSFDANALKKLGRVHGRPEALNAISTARKAGCKNVNLDLMYALPEQTLAAAKADLQQAIDLGPEHISYYQLTIEPNTYFHRYPPPLPTEELAWDMHMQGIELLENAGYQQYEVSAYSQPNKQCAHNLNYWQFGDYVAIGAGAHGKASSAAGIKRYWHEKHPQRFLEQSTTIREINLVPQEDILFEALMNTLRLNDGIATNTLLARTGLTYQALVAALTTYVDDNLLVFDQHKLKCTPHGHLHLNSILSKLLSGN